MKPSKHSKIVPPRVRASIPVNKQEIDDAVRKASDIVEEVNVEKIAKDLATRTQNNFSSRNPEDILTDSRLSSTYESVKRGTAEADTKIKALLGSSSEALTEPVSFITKSVKEIIGSGITPEDLGASIDALPDISQNVLATLSTRAGLDSISSASELGNTLSSISKNFESKLAEGAKVLSNFLESTEGFKGNVISAFGDLTSKVSDPITKINSTIDSVISEGSGFLKKALDKLPDKVKGPITNSATSILSEIVDGNKKRIANSTSMVSSVLGGFGSDRDFTSDVSKLNSLGSTYNKYPRYTDEDGNYIPGVSNDSNLTNKQIGNVYNVARSYLCGNIHLPNLFDFASHKDLFDLLLMYSGIFGLANLLRGLLDCSKPYMDHRSYRILRDIVKPSAIARGDAYLYEEATKDHHTVKGNTRRELKYLNSNMVLSRSDGSDEVRKTKYNDVVKENGLSVLNLVEGDTYGNRRSINTQDVLVMSASNTKVIDEGIGRDRRMMSSKLYHLYG